MKDKKPWENSSYRRLEGTQWHLMNIALFSSFIIVKNRRTWTGYCRIQTKSKDKRKRSFHVKTLIKNRHQYGLLGFHLFWEQSRGLMQHIKYQDNIFITLINQSTLSFSHRPHICIKCWSWTNLFLELCWSCLVRPKRENNISSGVSSCPVWTWKPDVIKTLNLFH